MSATARKLGYDDFGDDHHLADPAHAGEPESIILVRETRRTRTRTHTHAAPRPRLLPATSSKRRARLGIFAIVCLAIATVGLVSMLIVNTMLASGAFTVSELQAEATSQPSLPIDSHRNPPPGATITAAPLAVPFSGKKGVSVALEMFLAIGSPHCLNQLSGAGWFSTLPVFRGIELGSSGASKG